MRTFVKYIFLISVLFTFIDTKAQIRVHSEIYTTKNGLAQNDVNDLAADSSGFIWFATENGISRFDGYTFVNHKITTQQFGCSLNNQFVQIVVDSKNNVWALNSMGQALVYNQKNMKYTLFPEPKENRAENYIFIKQIECCNSEVWLIGSENGALRITEENGKYVASNIYSSEQNFGQTVNKIYSDKDHNLWVLTNNGIGFIPNGSVRIKNTFYNQYAFFDYIDSNNETVYACSDGTIIIYDKVKKRYREIKMPQYNSNINSIYKLSDSDFLLVCNSDGLYSLNLATSTVTKKHAFSNILSSWKDEYNNVWLCENNRLYKFDAKTYQLSNTNIKLPSDLMQREEYYHSDFSFGYIDKNNGYLWRFSDNPSISLQNESNICSIHQDNSGIFWTKTVDDGIQKNVPVNSTVQFVKSVDNTDNNYGVTAVLEDNLGNFWIATSDKKIRIYSSNLMLIGYLNTNGQISSSESSFGLVSTLYQDRDGNVWIGSGRTVNKLQKQSNAKFNIHNYILDKNCPKNTLVTDIIEDRNGRIWITTDGDGLQLLHIENDKYEFYNRRNQLKNCYPPALLKTNCLYEDSKGNMWVGASEGFMIFSIDFPQMRFLKFFYYNPENSNITTSVVSGIYEDNEGKIWMASYGGGLSRTASSFELGDTPEFISYNKENAKLNSDLILSIAEDAQGNLWIVTEKNLLKYSKNNNVFDSYSLDNEIGHKGLGSSIFTRTKTGAFILGSNQGFYYIDPLKIKNEVHSPQMAFTRFQLFNKDVDIYSEDAPIKTDINESNEIVLKSRQNVFSIEYTSLDFGNTSNVEYAYKLDNFEENWNFVGNKRIATYTNLPPGNYVFRVKSTNREGNWCSNDKIISIQVLPTFWQTGWAWLLYVIIFVGIVGGVLYAYLVFYKMKAKMKLDQEISTMKMQFFTDISHELRTPLTLIDAPLENVLNNGNVSVEDKAQLEIVQSNTKRMLRMLTQILDFRKLQSNKMRLRVEKTNIFQLVEKCCTNFRKMAERRNIEFNVECIGNCIFYWVDRDKIDTVMFNLLSNAFKFTPEEKRITVQVTNSVDNCTITVSDEGCGMPKDKLNIIFDRYSTLRPKSLTNQSGTGIGLALVKEILDLHKASISVESHENEGSVFTVVLKAGTDHFDEISADIIINDTEMPVGAPSKNQDSSDDPEDKDRLLVIEDNDDLRHFIVSVLSKKFHTIEASNGKEGYEKTLQEMPDFVISDIMMPIMDGIEYIKKVRENEQTSHIPVVLLTAKTDMQSKIECLKIGANDYITKPFSMVYLQTRIDNILEERRLLQEKYRHYLQNNGSQESLPNALQNDKLAKDEVDKRDDEFMQKMIKYINDHIDNANLSPDELANGLKISRWNLTSKVKSLVGQPPVEFIKDIRLNKAAKLIDDGELSMTQIAYMIGMTDSRYFSRCFKQKFGITPTEYKKRNN